MCDDKCRNNIEREQKRSDAKAIKSNLFECVYSITIVFEYGAIVDIILITTQNFSLTAQLFTRLSIVC